MVVIPANIFKEEQMPYGEERAFIVLATILLGIILMVLGSTVGEGLVFIGILVLALAVVLIFVVTLKD